MMHPLGLLFIWVLFISGCGGTSSNDSSTTEGNPSSTTRAPVLALEQSGKAIVEKGIFAGDCVYGVGKSLSDHAPVIYGKIATWNITNFVTHKQFVQGAKTFFTHKFRMNAAGQLIDERSAPIFPLEKSEVNDPADGWPPNINEHYAERLVEIAAKIKELFNTYDLDMMALQEIPAFSAREATPQRRRLRPLFENALKPLVFMPAVQPQSGVAAPDVALVVKAGSGFVARNVDKELRVQSYCDDSVKECAISAHLKMPTTDEEVTKLCAGLDSFVVSLHQQGYHRIKILGDYNIPADMIQQNCNSWTLSPVVLKTTSGPGASCSDNQGGLTPKNIDLELQFGG